MTNEEAIKKFNKLFPHIREYQKLAKDFANIEDIFQDNGGKYKFCWLQTYRI